MLRFALCDRFSLIPVYIIEPARRTTVVPNIFRRHNNNISDRSTNFGKLVITWIRTLWYCSR